MLLLNVLTVYVIGVLAVMVLMGAYHAVQDERPGEIVEQLSRSRSDEIQLTRLLHSLTVFAWPAAVVYVLVYLFSRNDSPV